MRSGQRTAIFSVKRRRILAALFVVASLSCFGSVARPHATSAQTPQAVKTVQETAQAAGLAGGADLIQIIGRIINIFLGTLGVIFLVLLLYAGYRWMTAGGEAKQVDEAKAIIKNAVIGLIIIMSAWGITYFILKALSGEGGAGGGPPISWSGPQLGGLVGSAGSLGSGVIEYHLPERNATNVPRNTPVIITFKEPINPASFIDGWTQAASTTHALNASNVQIFRTGASSTALTSTQANVSYTTDQKTFVIRPTDLLGSAQTNVKYTVTLRGGAGGIQLAAGGAAFGGSFSNGYTWGFEVSTLVDTTPPKVLAVVPRTGLYPRNIVVQVTFNEAVDPVGASGVFENGVGFTNISIRPNSGLGTPLNGQYAITNRYRTVEFTTTDVCGTNSCGKTVYCLPANATLQVDVKSATMSQQPPMALLSNSGFDGITDVVGNSLDGDGNGTAVGPPADNYSWTFGTSNTIKLDPPKIVSTVPDANTGPGQSMRPLDEDVVATFGSLMQPSTFNSANALIDAHGFSETNPDTFWYFVGMELLNAQGNPLQPGEDADHAALVMKHRVYLPSGKGAKQLNFYNPYLLSGLQDAYQNCFNPSASASCDGPNCCNNQISSSDCTKQLP